MPLMALALMTVVMSLAKFTTGATMSSWISSRTMARTRSSVRGSLSGSGVTVMVSVLSGWLCDWDEPSVLLSTGGSFQFLGYQLGGFGGSLATRDRSTTAPPVVGASNAKLSIVCSERLNTTLEK